MTKVKIIASGLETAILRERNTLAKFNSSFVVSMLCSFQNKNNLFTVMELIPGGDLQFHLTHYDYYYTETQLKFLLTNIILGLEYIHKKDIVHCNLKPDNIMFDSRGFVKIIGFSDACEKNTVMNAKLIENDQAIDGFRNASTYDELIDTIGFTLVLHVSDCELFCLLRHYAYAYRSGEDIDIAEGYQ